MSDDLTVCVCVCHLDHAQPLLLLSVTLQETVLGSLQSVLAVVQTGQSLQGPVAPHDVQLQDGVVIHRAEQRRAALTATDQHTITARSVQHVPKGLLQVLQANPEGSMAPVPL